LELSEQEFKTVLINILNVLMDNVKEQTAKRNDNSKNKKKMLEIKNTVTFLKNALMGIQ
jgi:hypothetical protein